MSSRMRVVFCGTPQFAVPSLQQILGHPDYEVLAVITQPDKPRGRGQTVGLSAVKQAALESKLRVFQPEKIRSAEAQKFLEELAPDCVVIIAYGQIVPARLLGVAKQGWINLHASLLPKYRGAAPIHWGHRERRDQERGNVHANRRGYGHRGSAVAGRDGDWFGRDGTRSWQRGWHNWAPEVMLRTLRGLQLGTLLPRPQDEGQASKAPILKKEDGRIDWNRPASEIYNRMRGFTPWPGSYTFVSRANLQR